MKKTILSTVFTISLILISCKPSVKSDCSYKVPEGYHLGKNNEGDYGIMDEYGSILGYNVTRGEYSYFDYQDSGKMLFSDSCMAKGLLKQYLEDKNNLELK